MTEVVKVSVLLAIVLFAGQVVRSDEDPATQLEQDVAAVRNEVRVMLTSDGDGDEVELSRKGMVALAKSWSKRNVGALFEWTIADGRALLDLDDHESFYHEVGIQMALQFPREALDFIDKKFRLMRRGDDESGDALLVGAILKAVLFADS
jgi:hypothetical protein